MWHVDGQLQISIKLLILVYEWLSVFSVIFLWKATAQSYLKKIRIRVTAPIYGTGLGIAESRCQMSEFIGPH